MNTEILDAIQSINGCQFSSLTYTSKSTGETARYNISLGFNYNTVVQDSLTELEILKRENKDTWTPIEKQAAQEVTESLQKTLDSHSIGEQNPAYKKAEQYIPIGNGLKINENDGSLQLFGLLNSKVVIEEGIKEERKSKPLTIAKNKIRSMLKVSKVREFAIDAGNVLKAKVNGNVLEFQ